MTESGSAANIAVPTVGAAMPFGVVRRSLVAHADGVAGIQVCVGMMSNRPTTEIDVEWQGGFEFTSRDAYGHTVTVDAPVEAGDSFEGFRPGELLLTSLAGCSGIDVVSILRKQRQDVTGLEIRVRDTQLSEPPWTWVEIELEYLLKGRGLKRSAVERAIHLSETKYCSVGATLTARARITSTYKIVDEIRDGS